MSLYFKGIDWDQINDGWTYIRTIENNDWCDIAYIKWKRGTNENIVVTIYDEIKIFKYVFNNDFYKETVKEFIEDLLRKNRWIIGVIQNEFNL